MRPLALVVVFALATTIAGCKKQAPEASVDTAAASDSTPDAPVFVDLSMEDEAEMEDDLMGAELMVADAECSNLRKLEPKAMMGKLSDPEIRCLDKSIKESETQTYKDKVSRVLMADAYAKKNDDRWEAIVKRHLNDIDRSDPDLCYKYSTFMYKKVADKGPDAADEVMKWADVALENKAVWSGDAYVKRVSALYKVKAMAGYQKWQWLENKYKEAPNELIGKDRDDARNEAKNLAREWLAYSKDAGLDQEAPHDICVSAAGTAEFCEI